MGCGPCKASRRALLALLVADLEDAGEHDAAGLVRVWTEKHLEEVLTDGVQKELPTGATPAGLEKADAAGAGPSDVDSVEANRPVFAGRHPSVRFPGGGLLHNPVRDSSGGKRGATVTVFRPSDRKKNPR